MVDKIFHLTTILRTMPVGARLHLPKDVASKLEIDRYLSDDFEQADGVGYSTPDEEAQSGRPAEWVFKRVGKDTLDALDT